MVLANGKTIKEMRIDMGLSQQELAIRLNRSVPTIKGYEQGKTKVPQDMALKIMELYQQYAPVAKKLTTQSLEEQQKLKEALNSKLDKLRKQLHKTLRKNKNLTPITKELVEQYLAIYKTKDALERDIDDRGPAVMTVRGMVTNESVRLLNVANGQMLTLMESLGLVEKKEPEKKVPKGYV